MSTCIVAALPREISELVRGTKPNHSLRAQGVFLHRVADSVVVAAGMGAERVTLAVKAARDLGEIETIISIGLAGACHASVAPGTLLRAGTVVDASTGERFETSDAEEPAVLVSIDRIASAREKKRLNESYRAAMVDMEAATVARLARAHGLRFRAVKGISDAHDFEIESLARFSGARGQFQTARFAMHTAARPHTWKSAMTLGRHSKIALRLLTEAITPIINTR